MKQFNILLQAQFNKMCATGKLFRTGITGDKVWEKYLESFDNDPIFRDPNSTSHNCNNCKNFIRRYGNIVAVDENYHIISIFDVEAKEEFKSVANALSVWIKASNIKDVFFETFDELQSLPYQKCSKQMLHFQLGINRNTKQYTKEEAEKFGVVKPDEIRTFDHMHLLVPSQFVDMTGKSVESIMGEYRDAKNVFQRAMETISLDTLKLVKDLINQESLLDGKTHLYKIEQILPLKEEYDSLVLNEKDQWCWVKSYKLPFAKFRNELIGVLCSELSEGKELNEAVLAWNKRVDPANYMKATAPITKKQIEEAKQYVEDNGYTESFNRRFATLSDIKVSEIKHINGGKGDIKSVSIFDSVKPATSSRHKRNEFDGVEEVNIEKFMKDILPSCTSVEVMLRNIHENNMVTMTTANDPESKKIFKWDNNYSWTYNGNLAGKSQIKEAVKSQGGKVDGVLRFSIMWASGSDDSDLDAHCLTPDGTRIYFSQKVDLFTKGNLDIDITQPQYHKLNNKQEVVENITFPSLQKMKNGVYKFMVHQFSARNSQGFKAEIEFNGEIYSYEYKQPLPMKHMVEVAYVTFNNGEFSIQHNLPESNVSSKIIYGLDTNEFHKVNLVCLSPNHWEPNEVGNKHYFFMLENAKTPTSIRSFHNENLIPELAQHRKVLEVLGATSMIESKKDSEQLSGLGFNATVRDELIVKLSGNFKRVIKIKF